MTVDEARRQMVASFAVPPPVMGRGVGRHPVMVAYERGWLGEPGSLAAKRRAWAQLRLEEDDG